MSFNDLLVHVDNSPNCAARVAVAAGLAKRHQAHLSGVYVIAYPLYKPRHDTLVSRMEEAREKFMGVTGQAGVSAEWRCVEWSVAGVSVTEILTLHSYCKDLVIVGQTDRAGDGAVPADLPEKVVLSAGRPVLIVPYAGTFTSVGEQVMVAWKSGRESVRALGDAMPFLGSARQVNILAIMAGETGEAVSGASPEEVRLHLSRHGIEARTERQACAEGAVEDVIMNRAWEEGCDLVVMGAYTHTSRGTVALGSVARNVLRRMTIPVLMSH